MSSQTAVQSSAGTPDPQILEGLRDGDESAFREIVRRHHTGMVRMALGFVPSRAVAEEVAQETWAAVLKGLTRFEGRSSIKTWIFRILVKRAMTRGEREGRMVSFSSLGSKDEDGGLDPSRFDSKGHWVSKDHYPKKWDEATPDQILLSAESRSMVEQAVAALPANQRSVVTLRDLEGWDSKEVCNALDISETNQRVLLHRGRAKVRAALENYLDGELS